jgi:hypothetical protein
MAAGMANVRMEPSGRRMPVGLCPPPPSTRRPVGFADLGSLGPATRHLVNADPTQDIRNSDKIDRVMLNGRLYDAATLNEVVTGNRQRRPYYWENAGQGGGASQTTQTSADGED